MIPGNRPGSSGHAVKAGWRPYLVTTRTSFSIIASILWMAHGIPAGARHRRLDSWRAEELASPGNQHVVDPDVVHEILPDPLAGSMNAPTRFGDRRSDVG